MCKDSHPRLQFKGHSAFFQTVIIFDSLTLALIGFSGAPFQTVIVFDSLTATLVGSSVVPFLAVIVFNSPTITLCTFSDCNCVWFKHIYFSNRYIHMQ